LVFHDEEDVGFTVLWFYGFAVWNYRLPASSLKLQATSCVLNHLSLSQDVKSYTFKSTGLQLAANGLQLNAELLNAKNENAGGRNFESRLFLRYKIASPGVVVGLYATGEALD